MITIHQRYRQTDRQTTCDRNTALCTKVHRAVKRIVSWRILEYCWFSDSYAAADRMPWRPNPLIFRIQREEMRQFDVLRRPWDPSRLRCRNDSPCNTRRHDDRRTLNKRTECSGPAKAKMFSTVWVKKNPPLRFSDIFPKRLGIFNQFFTHLLHDHFYTRVQIFIQISPTLTKLCHTKRDHLANFYISLEL